MRRHTIKHHWIFFTTILSMMGILMGLVFTQPDEVDAYSLNSEGPERKATLNISYTSYEWWLLTWSHSQVICQVYIEHEGLPEPEEIQYYCGKRILDDWMETSSCEYSEDDDRAAHCPGLYLHLANVTPGEREIEVDLLPPEVHVDIADCNPQPPENRCDTLPSLHLTAEEPLPNESIINIQGYLGEESFSCEGDECKIPLPPTGENGIQVTFWAESSYGDSSETYTAQVRVIPWGDFVAPDVEADDVPQWYVDILSTQYIGKIESTCSQIWSAFPPIGNPPQWLSSPDHPDGLVSNQSYYYLAGNLITQGLVDIAECPDRGLESPGIANQCGLEAACELINEWQNQFNSEIIQVADETGVPAQLMKNIFSRESQFWPGFSATYTEAGLGHLSDLGADTVLLWNPSFFTQFCPLVLDTSVCQKGFGNLDIAEQEMLRGALVQKVNAACPDCPIGIDLRQANFSISIFARSILANCEQVGQILYNTTRKTAGEVSSYEDLWRFTLVNYTGGPGCLSNAIQQTYDSRHPLTWENLIEFLDPGCKASIDYVEDITSMASTMEEETHPTQPTQAAPTSSSTPTITDTPEESALVTPTPTPTEAGYP